MNQMVHHKQEMNHFFATAEQNAYYIFSITNEVSRRDAKSIEKGKKVEKRKTF